MQMKKKHYEFLKMEFKIDKDKFLKMYNEDGEELDELINELMFKECDAAEEEMETGIYPDYGNIAGDIIDYICGPYSHKAVSSKENNQVQIKVRYLGESDPFGLINGKIYDVLAIEDEEWYRIVDGTDEDCLYPVGAFEIVGK